MSVKMHGPRREFIARWMMRLEAAGQVLRMAFLGVTAASTLSTALSVMGYQWLAAPALAVGFVATLLFAYVYVDMGVFNRKNREKVDHGNNFARPDMRIDDELTARGIVAAQLGRPLNDDERNATKQELDAAFAEHRNGVDVE